MCQSYPPYFFTHVKGIPKYKFKLKLKMLNMEKEEFKAVVLVSYDKDITIKYVKPLSTTKINEACYAHVIWISTNSLQKLQEEIADTVKCYSPAEDYFTPSVKDIKNLAKDVLDNYDSYMRNPTKKANIEKVILKFISKRW